MIRRHSLMYSRMNTSSVAGAVMSATAVFYNIGEVRNAKVPAATLKRARRK